jgi:hypothetical protein
MPERQSLEVTHALPEFGKIQDARFGNNMTLGIPLPKTPDGRVYRYSSNDMPALRIRWSSAKAGAYSFA